MAADSRIHALSLIQKYARYYFSWISDFATEIFAPAKFCN